MWAVRSEELLSGRGRRLAVEQDSRPAAFEAVIDAWRHDSGFRSLFNSLLADTPFAAFRWETPPVTSTTVSRPFEFVLLDSPELLLPPNPEVFSGHFINAAKEKHVVTFLNLGGDALLVVPCPLVEPSAYGHLGAFVRQAPEEQRHALWQAIGETMTRRVGARPVWLNTAGGGVPWLHVRLDDKPKYYVYRPYRLDQKGKAK